MYRRRNDSYANRNRRFRRRIWGNIKNFIGVIGEKSNEKVKKGMYLYSDAFDNDAELMNMADEIYNHENGDNTKILYFEIG